MSIGSGHAGPVERAHDALDAGAVWRARDILLEYVEHVPDTTALTLLGEVLHGMGDLPRAGAMWFAAGAKGPEVDAAVAAWREQSRDDFGVMWRSLPAAVRAEPRAPRLEALRDKARAAGRDPGANGQDDQTTDDLDDGTAGIPGRRQADDPDEGGGTDAAQVIAWVLAAVFVVLAVIGAVTALGWVVPG